MIGAVLVRAEREIGLARRERGPIDQHLLGTAVARRAHDARVLGAGHGYSCPIGIGAIRQRHLGRGRLDAAFQLLEQLPAQARKRRQHRLGVAVLGLDVGANLALVVRTVS